jgi:hypothetical protein
MIRATLQARLDRLKLAPAMRCMTDVFSKIYGYIWEMETLTEPIADGDEENRKKRFEAEHGTRDEFVETRMKAWNKRYPGKGGEE